MSTLTHTHTTASGAKRAGWLDSVRLAVDGWRRAAVPRAALHEGAAALLARADTYEATQPGFAADLRASAHRLIESR